MGQMTSRTDFEWVNTDQPHASRRKIILEKYPQIKDLFGYDPSFKYIVIALVFVQFLMLFVMKDQSWPIILLVAYCFGGVINHSLALAIHDIGHNMAFGHGRLKANQFFGFFCNLPLAVPIAASFKKYHADHHRFLSVADYDPDLPTLMEARLFCKTFGKFCWICLQPFFYAFRPLFANPKPPNRMEVYNFVIQFIFDVAVVYFFGWKVLLYLFLGTVLTMGLYPLGGHFISEHYMFAKGYETYSYYGPLNFITFNAGYHNEHHDFPAVPHSRLPEVRRILQPNSTIIYHTITVGYVFYMTLSWILTLDHMHESNVSEKTITIAKESRKTLPQINIKIETKHNKKPRHPSNIYLENV